MLLCRSLSCLQLETRVSTRMARRLRSYGGSSLPSTSTSVMLTMLAMVGSFGRSRAFQLATGSTTCRMTAGGQWLAEGHRRAFGSARVNGGRKTYNVSGRRSNTQLTMAEVNMTVDNHFFRNGTFVLISKCSLLSPTADDFQDGRCTVHGTLLWYLVAT